MVEVRSIVASGKSPPEPAPPAGTVAAPSDAAPALTFQDVYEAHVDFVWRMVCRLGVRDAATEDVVQDVFLVVHRRLVEFEGRSSVRTWLVGIIRRVLFERRRSTRRKLPHASACDAPTDVDALADGTAKGPDERAAHAEAVRLLYDLLDELDEDKREVFILVELEQLPVAEIAEALGINVNTVYSRLRLAREKFDAALARHRARDGWRLR
jgi:RNA polymerase sigma-70 factor (ECF subfamily)